VRDLLKLSRASSRYTALVTSGYTTLEGLDQIGPYLDGIGLELRAFDDAAYARLTGVEHWRGILDVAARARDQWSCHIEITTRLHPNVNDSIEQVQALAGWVCDTLGPNTPWHVLPGDAGAAAAATVARARRLAHEAGLHFVYGPEPAQNTACPACGAVVITRAAAGVRVVGLDGGRCAACGADLGVRTSIFKR
jgi:pyruvate formate lyase activating enzyme